MAALTVYDIALTGDSKAYAAAVGPDTFANDGKVFIHVKNTNASPRNLTFNSQKPCDQGSDHDIVVTVAATSGDEMVGPFPVARFNDASGNVTITYDATAGVTLAALRLP